MTSSWYTDLTDPLSTGSHNTGRVPSPPALFTIDEEIAAPSSTKTTTQHARRVIQKKQQETDELKLKRAREQAFAPAKSIPMNLIMSYFSGSSLQVITLSMTWMMFFNGPLKQLMGTNDMFAKLETESNKSTVFIYKALYCLCLLATMGVGVYKLSSLGILPNTASDWVAWEQPSTVSIFNCCESD